MTSNEVLASIMDADKTACRAYSEALRERWRQLSANDALKARAEFRVGQWVEFNNKRTGGVVKGEVVSFGPKNVKVRAKGPFGPVLWTVHPALLRPSSGE